MSDNLDRIKTELDDIIGDKDIQLLKDVSDKLNLLRNHDEKLELISKRLLENGESNLDIKQLLSYISDLVDGIKAKEVTIPSEFEVTVKNQPEYPDSVKVSNLQDISIPKPYKEVSIKEGQGIIKSILGSGKSLATTIAELVQRIFKVEVVNNRTPVKAIAVRLVDRAGEKFIDPNPNVVVSGGGTRIDTSPLAKEAKQDDIISAIDDLMVNSASYAIKVTEDGDVTYIGFAQPGSDQADAIWRAMKVDETTGTIITWADGNTSFDNVATDLTSLSYS